MTKLNNVGRPYSAVTEIVLGSVTFLYRRAVYTKKTFYLTKTIFYFICFRIPIEYGFFNSCLENKKKYLIALSFEPSTFSTGTYIDVASAFSAILSKNDIILD